jgi:hypothetical protein
VNRILLVQNSDYLRDLANKTMNFRVPTKYRVTIKKMFGFANELIPGFLLSVATPS